MGIFAKLDRILDQLYTGCGYLAAIFLLALGLLVVTSIVSRMLGVYLPGVVEFSGYSMAASSFFALSYTFRHKAHIRVGLLLSRLHGRARRVVELWCLAISSIFSGFLAFYLIKLTLISRRFEERSEGADAILIWIPQSALALGATLFAVCIAHQFIRILFGVAEPDAGAGGDEPIDLPEAVGSAPEDARR
jgi:TRAP-type C4-dicarboxylate transport system permease small subunit